MGHLSSTVVAAAAITPGHGQDGRLRGTHGRDGHYLDSTSPRVDNFHIFHSFLDYQVSIRVAIQVVGGNIQNGGDSLHCDIHLEPVGRYLSRL